ncbi:MAG: hypothetical protein C0497_06395 [Gemmatimonas sp.]|nr:hypothetical protein [Gemmatimonas sp.]
MDDNRWWVEVTVCVVSYDELDVYRHDSCTPGDQSLRRQDRIYSQFKESVTLRFNLDMQSRYEG